MELLSVSKPSIDWQRPNLDPVAWHRVGRWGLGLSHLWGLPEGAAASWGCKTKTPCSHRALKDGRSQEEEV